MKLSDYVAEFLASQGVGHVFLISGGAIVHCADSVASHPKLEYICTQHEQGAGAAADAYARINGNLGVAMTTSGPGATNLATSVCNAYFDSIPILLITGQVATFRLRPDKDLRQKGFQETDVVSIFQSITKYAVLVRDAADIRYELEKAVHLARAGRPGPVLVDIPDDLQRVDIDPEKLRSFSPKRAAKKTVAAAKIKKLLALIKSAERPVLILGAGVRVSGVPEQVLKFARDLHLPVLLTWGGMDLMPREDELNMGGVGVCGPRSGNFAVQNSDLVVAIGTRLSQMITGGKQNLFAPKAKKAMIDIDAKELKKFTKNDFTLDLAIECSIPGFIKTCAGAKQKDRFQGWRRRIKAWDEQFPVCLPEYYEQKEKLVSYVFIKELARAAKPNDIVITDAGGNLSWTMQAFDVKEGQRLFSAWNHSPMGYSLPAAIGAALAGKRDVICIIGDGGLMMCLEELATIQRYQLPVKIFIMNNHGHGIQKQTLDTWLNSRYVAVDEKSGLYFPDFIATGKAFGMPSHKINGLEDLRSGLPGILRTKGPVLCDVEIVENQRIVPMLKFGAGLEDLEPKLPSDVIKSIMSLSATS
jgi:acetolactate synthase I/II/III large subunit